MEDELLKYRTEKIGFVSDSGKEDGKCGDSRRQELDFIANEISGKVSLDLFRYIRC